MFFLDGAGRQLSLPVGWTDAAEPDVFVTMAAGRSPFRFVDLVELRRFDRWPVRLNDCKHDYAANVKQIMPRRSGGLQSTSCGAAVIEFDSCLFALCWACQISHHQHMAA